MRNSQVSRIYRILTLLESSRQGLTVKAIHEKIRDHDEVTDRTVRRDLEALEAAGFPLERETNPKDEGLGDLYSIKNSVRVAKHLTLSSRELFALYLTRGVLTPLKDTAVFGDLEKVFNKIEGLLTIQAREHLSELMDEIKFEPGPKWGLGIDPDLLETILAACSNQQVVELLYQSALKGERRRRKLGPHFLYFAKGTVYMVAEDLEQRGSEPKIFSLARSSDAVMTDEAYDKAQLDPEQYFKGSFGVYKANGVEQIELHFKPQASSYVVERAWHPSQRLVRNSDGSVTLHLEVGTTPDLVQFILGFGDGVEVKKPEALKSSVAAAARRVAELYK